MELVGRVGREINTQLGAGGIALSNGCVLQDPWARNPRLLQLPGGQNPQGVEWQLPLSACPAGPFLSSQVTCLDVGRIYHMRK